MKAQYWNEKDVSEYTGISLSTLRNWRSMGSPIRYCKIGRMVKYNKADVIEFMDEHLIDPRNEKTL